MRCPTWGTTSCQGGGGRGIGKGGEGGGGNRHQLRASTWMFEVGESDGG